MPLKLLLKIKDIFLKFMFFLERYRMKYIVVNDFDYVQGGASKVAIENAMLLHRTGESVVFFSGCSKNEKYPFPVFSLNQKEVANGQNPFRNLYNKVSLLRIPVYVSGCFSSNWVAVTASMGARIKPGSPKSLNPAYSASRVTRGSIPRCRPTSLGSRTVRVIAAAA